MMNWHGHSHMFHVRPGLSPFEQRALGRLRATLARSGGWTSGTLHLVDDQLIGYLTEKLSARAMMQNFINLNFYPPLPCPPWRRAELADDGSIELSVPLFIGLSINRPDRLENETSSSSASLRQQAEKFDQSIVSCPHGDRVHYLHYNHVVLLFRAANSGGRAALEG